MSGAGIDTFGDKGSSYFFVKDVKVCNLDADNALVGGLGGAFINAAGPSRDAVNYAPLSCRGGCFFSPIN